MTSDNNKKIQTFANDYLIAMRDFALSKGISARSLIEGSDISLETLLNPPPRLPYQVMEHIFLSLEKHPAPFRQLALEYGRFLAIGSHGMLGIAAQSCQNLKEACELLSAYIKIRAEGTLATISENAQGLTLSIFKDPEFEHSSREEVSEFFELMLLVNLEYFVKTVIGRHFPNSKALLHLTQQQPDDIDLYHYLDLGVLHFEQPCLEIVIPKNWLELPLIQDNAELRKLAAQKCESELESLSPKDFIQEIRDRIRATEGIKPSIDAMAEQLFMSTSTLQRKLKLQKTTYQTIKQQERLAEAHYLLANTNKSIEDIALTLGFSDSSNFSKSFKSWTGQTPHTYRQQA